MSKTLLLTIHERQAEKNVFGFEDNKVLAFKSGLTVDADGSPHAYHPGDTGLDSLQNAMDGDEFVGLVTDHNGKPLVQTANDPAPGFFISCTTLQDKTKAATDPLRYVDSEQIPFVALPPQVRDFDVNVGDIGLAVNAANGRRAHFIFADIGPRRHIGEGSIKLATLLGLSGNPKVGGTDHGIIYVLFAGTGDGNIKSFEEIGVIGQNAAAAVDIDAIIAAF